MSIKQKIKSVWDRIAGKTSKNSCDDDCGTDCGCGGKGKEKDKAKGKRDAELGADEVVKKEVFPKKRKPRATAAKNKPASKRTRPTNPDYTMIDPSDDTFDAGKS